jgi:RimJ/RimL family protein N-acetyltransferase
MTTDNLQPSTCNSLHIRPATPTDIPHILAFIRELAEYEREPASAVATHADIVRDGFGPSPRFHCLMAEWSEPAPGSSPSTDNLQPATCNFLPAGFALYFYNYSTWRGRAGIYLEDLFVRPAFRGKGIGKALLASVATIAVAEGCARFEWAVLDWNTPAIDFYRSVGAVMQSEWRIMRVSGDALRRLAQSPGA